MGKSVWVRCAVGAVLAGAVAGCGSGSNPATSVAHDADDIGGVVTGPAGPEAGVWVIAESRDLPTKFRKIVVTDDEGKYLIPDLPEANYAVWVRGYGLVDSPQVDAVPGSALDLTATAAPTPQAAAQYYPANYWYSMLEIPPADQFPGTGDAGNGIGAGMLTQDYWINQVKTNCNVCHQVGNKATREIPASLQHLSTFDAWSHRIRTGQDAPAMINMFGGMGTQRGLEIFSRWTDRIAAGEVPSSVPSRPEGVERNVVLTLWEWGKETTFAHDDVPGDKRDPLVNANGPVYGIDWANDLLLIADTKDNSVRQITIPNIDPDTPNGKTQTLLAPSVYWGDEIYWKGQAIPNHLAMDSEKRVWMAARFRPAEKQPAFCATHPSARLAPQKTGPRQIIWFDPEKEEFHNVDLCFDVHHVAFATDEDQTLYGNGVQNGVLGWVNTRLLLETGDAAAAQGWCKGYYDIDGDGKVDPAKDQMLETNSIYSVVPNNLDGSVWGAMPAPMPGAIIRIDPKTCVGELYQPPFNNAATEDHGYTPRGIDIDSEGVIWTALAGSGHMASFDRRKCKVLTGKEATSGQHCPEGWTLYPSPGPGFDGVDRKISVESHYYNFIDQHDTLGLGRDVPMANGNNSDSILALMPESKEWVTLRVPYPMGFFQRGMAGRIDDPDAGWKGRGLYANYGPNAVWHIEGGKGSLGSLVKIQLRPDPLAK